MKRILVLTAGFGEGHNSAARAIREALEATGQAEVRTADLYAKSVPVVNRTVKFGYSVAINRYPRMWRLIFSALDHPGLMERTMWAAGPIRSALDRELVEFCPDAIVSTYPLYAYLFRHLQARRLGIRTPFVTMITDSIGVNSAWHRCLSDAFVVTDEHTGDLLAARGVPREILHAFGFPVARYFATAKTVSARSKAPWKLLFMPSSQLTLTLRQIRELLKLPDVEVTVLAGRHGRIFDAVKESGLADGSRCTLIGWTDAMPKLLCEHHAFIGKAGGAIVQEAIAARCPFFVSHLVPGQEEGNITLIERLGVGTRALGNPGVLAEKVRGAFADDARQWRDWKANLSRVSHPEASDRIAKFLLELAAGS